MTSKRAVLWDLDGVLVDTMEVHFRAWVASMAHFGIDNYTREDFIRTFGMTNRAILPTFFPDAKLEEIDAMSEYKEKAFRDLVPGNVHILPGAEAWLKQFKSWGLAQAIASSAPIENIDSLADAMHIRPYFNALVSAYELGSKPSPAVFLKAAEMVGVPPQECMVVEDAPAGIEAASRAGMTCLAVETSHAAALLGRATRVVKNLEHFSLEDARLLLELDGAVA
ncbi:MAG: HAD-IA family hydrolase [Anaerolineaceae bacterium]|nr:HAD-IA family hydrolase [Anaerolineaceae bacterium]